MYYGYGGYKISKTGIERGTLFRVREKMRVGVRRGFYGRTKIGGCP